MRGMRGSVGSCNDLCEMVIHFSHTRTHKLTIVKHPPPSLNLKPYKGARSGLRGTHGQFQREGFPIITDVVV